MSLTLSVIFFLSSNTIIFYNLPASYGREIKGYTEQSLREVLTPGESINFILFNTLPPRVHYDEKTKAYYVNGPKKNSAKGELVAKPRLEYYMDQLTPSFDGFGMSAADIKQKLEKGYELLSSLKSYYVGDGEEGPAAPAEDGHANDADDDSPKESDAVVSPKESDAVVSPKESAAENSPKESAAENSPKESAAENSPKESAAEDSTKDNGNEDEKADEVEDSTKRYYDMAKDVITSDVGKLALKTGLGFIPGGHVAYTAFETGTKAYNAYNKIQDAEDEIPL